MNKLIIKIEGDEFDGLCRDLVDFAIEANPDVAHVLLRLLQLLLYGEWAEAPYSMVEANKSEGKKVE